jgi:hypothetical protein
MPPEKFVDKRPRGRQPSKETTARKRKAAAQLMPLPPSMALLEAGAIAPQTIVGYRRHAVVFAFFCASHLLDLDTPEKLGIILETYLNPFFLDGASRSEGSQAMAVIRHFSPLISSRGGSTLPRVH